MKILDEPVLAPAKEKLAYLLNLKSKLTDEQYDHYNKKGKFSATYVPYTSHDIHHDLQTLAGKKVVIYCNYEQVPCLDAPKFFGQYKFFIEDFESRGWCPEMEFENLEIIDEYADINIWNCDHRYLIIITDRKVAEKELGNYGKTCELPNILGRAYGSRNHDYVKRLVKSGGLFLYSFKNSEWKII